MVLPPNVIQPNDNYDHWGEIGGIVGNLVAKYPLLKLVDKQNAHDENIRKQMETEAQQFITNLTMDDKAINDYIKTQGGDPNDRNARDSVIKEMQSRKNQLVARPGENPAESQKRFAQIVGDIAVAIPNHTQAHVTRIAKGLDNNDESYKIVQENRKKDAINTFLSQGENGEFDVKKDGGMNDSAYLKYINELGLTQDMDAVKTIDAKRKAQKAALAREATYEQLQKNMNDPQFEQLSPVQKYRLVIKGAAQDTDEADKSNIMKLIMEDEAAKQFVDKNKVDWYNAETGRINAKNAGQKIAAEIGKMNSEDTWKVFNGAIQRLNNIETNIKAYQQILASDTASAGEKAKAQGEINKLLSEQAAYSTVVSTITEKNTGVRVDTGATRGEKGAVEAGGQVVAKRGIISSALDNIRKTSEKGGLVYTESEDGSKAAVRTRDGQTSRLFVVDDNGDPKEIDVLGAKAEIRAKLIDSNKDSSPATVEKVLRAMYQVD